MGRNELHKYISQKSADFFKRRHSHSNIFLISAELGCKLGGIFRKLEGFSFMKQINLLKAKNVHICTHIINRQVSGVLLQPSIAFRMSTFVDINFPSNR